MSRARLAVALLAGAALLAPAGARAASPYWGSFELRVGGYKPAIDDEFAVTPPAKGAYQTAFGGGRPMAFKAHLARALPWRTFGTLEIGAGVGYWHATGHGVFQGSQTSSRDRTQLKVVPTQLTLTWRLDLLIDRLSIPLVPYARASLERNNWWISNGADSTTKSGATNGYAYGGGLALVLDVFDPGLARELDQDTGINHTMITVDVAKTKIDDFGSKSSWNMSDSSLSISFGLLFVF